MGKYSKSAKHLRKRQNLILGVVLGLIVLGGAAALVIPRMSSGSGSASSMLIKNREVSLTGAYQLYQEGAFVLDVRTAEEWEAGHIPGSTSIPLEELAGRAAELPVGEPILIYCRTGNRSLESMNMLGSIGFMNLSSMDVGFQNWAEAGYPVESQ